MEGFKMRQTAIKELESSNCCPRMWHELYVKESISYNKSVFDKGKLFEYLCIGGTSTDGEIPKMDKLKDGSDSTDEKRIKIQAEYFKRYFNKQDELYLGYDIIATQLKLETQNRTGTIDIVAKHKDSPDTIYIIDLKLTADINNTYGDFSWANPKNMDFIQMYYYGNMYKKMYGEHINIKYAYFVFDYTKSLGKRFVELNISKKAEAAFEERVVNAFMKKIDYDNNGYPTKKSIDRCSYCTLSCKDRYSFEDIDFVEVKI